MREQTFRWLTKLSLCAFLLTALAIPCTANERRFQLQGTTGLLGDPFDEAGATMMGGSGNASHLGNLSHTGTIFFFSTSDPLLGASGLIRLRASNGDYLDVILVGTVDESSAVTATYFIFGGTGRFDDALGTGDFIAQHNPDGSFNYRATGTIDY